MEQLDMQICKFKDEVDSCFELFYPLATLFDYVFVKVSGQWYISRGNMLPDNNWKLYNTYE